MEGLTQTETDKVCLAPAGLIVQSRLCRDGYKRFLGNLNVLRDRLAIFSEFMNDHLYDLVDVPQSLLLRVTPGRWSSLVPPPITTSENHPTVYGSEQMSNGMRFTRGGRLPVSRTARFATRLPTGATACLGRPG